MLVKVNVTGQDFSYVLRQMSTKVDGKMEGYGDYCFYWAYIYVGLYTGVQL